MTDQVFTDNEHMAIFNAACARMNLSDRAKRQIRIDFQAMNNALIETEKSSKDPKLQQFIALMRSEDPGREIKGLPFNMNDYLNQLRAELLRWHYAQVFRVDKLKMYKDLTEQIRYICEVQDRDKYCIIPRDRSILAAIIISALQQSNTRAAS